MYKGFYYTIVEGRVGRSLNAKVDEENNDESIRSEDEIPLRRVKSGGGGRKVREFYLIIIMYNCIHSSIHICRYT